MEPHYLHPSVFHGSQISSRYFEEQGLPKGMTRGTLVFALASLVSWGSGEMVGWTQDKIEGPQPVVQTSDGLSQLLKLVVQAQPVVVEIRESGSD